MATIKKKDLTSKKCLFPAESGSVTPLKDRKQISFKGFKEDCTGY